MATTTYYPSTYGAAEFVGTGSTAGTANFQANYQDTTPNSYIVVTTVDGTNPQEYEITTGYTGFGTGTQFIAYQTPYSDTNTNETYAPSIPGGPGPAYLIVSNTPVSSSTSHQFASPSTPFVPTSGVSSDPTVVCFASGTLLKTPNGDVTVEDLQIGDVVLNFSGASRPICWLGHRTLDCRNHPSPQAVYPIRISAHAFGENCPSRDLFVSPGHTICVDVLGEVLIPAITLVNGSTIQQVEVDEVTYWHVELESHDVILAENLPAESYLNMGNRGFFKEADVVDLIAGPDVDLANRTHADFCRPFHADGPLVDVVKMQLAKRAEAQGWTLTRDLDMHLEIDGQRVDPVIRGLVARFPVPAGSKDVWLVSPTARPSDTMGTGDSRDLGLCVSSLRVDDSFEAREIAFDNPLLGVGFHKAQEDGRRWTAGRARLPNELWQGCEDGFYLRVELAGPPVPRWIAPPTQKERPWLALLA